MIRYVHWLFTTPAMVFLYSKVSFISSNELVFAMAMEFICIVTGFMASAMHFPFDIINLIISCVTFYFVISSLNKMLAIAIRFGEPAASTLPPSPHPDPAASVSPGRESPQNDVSYRQALDGARIFMMVTWLAFPTLQPFPTRHAMPEPPCAERMRLKGAPMRRRPGRPGKGGAARRGSGGSVGTSSG